MLILSHKWNILNESNGALLDHFNNCLTSRQILNTSSSPMTWIVSLWVGWGIPEAQLACTFPAAPPSPAVCADCRLLPAPFCTSLSSACPKGWEYSVLPLESGKAAWIYTSRIAGSADLKLSSCSVLGRSTATGLPASFLFCSEKGATAEIHGSWLYRSCLKTQLKQPIFLGCLWVNSKSYDASSWQFKAPKAGSCLQSPTMRKHLPAEYTKILQIRRDACHQTRALPECYSFGIQKWRQPEMSDASNFVLGG